MSETPSTNDAPENNSSSEQTPYNGDAEEHTSK